MANWNLPTINSNYLDFVTEVNDRDVDAIRLDGSNPTNLPINAIRFNRASNVFEELTTLPSTWTAKVIGLAGGGTGANTAAGARTALGIGSMGTQNSNAVNITGGSITGVNLNANDITSGIVALARGGTGSSLGLGGPGTVMLSNGTQVYFDTGVNISQLNASAVVAGTISDARLSANVALKNINNNFVAQTLATGTVIEGVNSLLYFRNPSSPVDNRNWRIVSYNTGSLYLERLVDSLGTVLTQFAFHNNGYFEAPNGGFVGFGGNITGLNASNLTTGTVNTARLGSGSANASTYLRGDNTWQPIVAPGIPAGLIAIFDTNCPIGWTRVAALDNRFPLGSTFFGAAGGAGAHRHGFSAATAGAGFHSHGFSGSDNPSFSAAGSATTGGASNASGVDGGGSFSAAVNNHTHDFSVTVNGSVSVNVSGSTDAVGDHAHNVSGDTGDADHIPPYLSVVFCRKD